jgi:hypothetical protein
VEQPFPTSSVHQTSFDEARIGIVKESHDVDLHKRDSLIGSLRIVHGSVFAELLACRESNVSMEMATADRQPSA